MAETAEGTFRCRIVTPDDEVFEGPVNHVVLPGVEGKFGVLQHHTPYLAALEIGEIKVEHPGGVLLVACSGGYAEVTEQGMVILAETAEQAEEIDVERAEAALERAQMYLAGEEESDLEEARHRDALQRARNRLRVARPD